MGKYAYIAICGTSRSGHNWTSKMFRAWMGNNGTSFYQFENLRPSDWMQNGNPRVQVNRKHSDPGVKEMDRKGLVFIQLRDYLNFSASWMKYLIGRNQAYRERKAQNVLDVWHELAMEAFDVTNHIPDKEILFYDHFVKSREYRQMICEKIGGNYNEEMIDFVPNNGHYSSFDSNRYEGIGSKMHVTSRWEWFLTEEGKPFVQYLAAKPEILLFYVKNFEPGEKKVQFINGVL